MRLARFLVVGALIALACTPTNAGHAAGAPAPNGGTILVELFTSQGCSSCPPADALLRKLASDPELTGRIVPLAYHVDYWDRLGWRDPFSSSAWSQRQRDYALALGEGQVYTPEAVVAGRTGLVGNDERMLRRAILDALGDAQPATITLQVALDRSSNAMVSVRTDVPRTTNSPLDLVLAVSESGFSTRVGHGENGGRTLESDFVVRRLETLSSRRELSGHHELARTIRLDRSWDASKLSFAVFLQEPRSRHVLGVATASLPVE